MSDNDYLLIGAGGHARQLVEIVESDGGRIVSYSDPRPADWLYDVPRVDTDDALDPTKGRAILGLGGVDLETLIRRLALFETLAARGFRFASLLHATATISISATVSAGASVLTRAVVNAAAWIGPAAIVNTGAIVEHDARIGAGAHIAPGAIVLGGARIGRAAMIGAGAVILPAAEIPDGAIVAAATRAG